MAQSHIRRQQPCFSAVLAVLVLAVAVAEATDNQLPHIKPPNLPNLSWEKLPFVGRFSKAAQAAKAAAAAITVSHALPKTPSLPPAPPVAGLAQPPAAGSQAVLLGQLDSSKFKAGSNKKGKDLKQLPTTGKNETQAGCSCLTDWENKPGGSKMNGCQNPDNDPLGAWCQVDPAQCQGYYSMYRTEKGKLKFYDYCVPVRERTKKGCLCSSDWAPAEGQVGKSHYRDACARPHADKGPRVCKVDSATCPPGVDPTIEFDECKDKQEQMVLQQDKTWHNCGCVTGWSYKYDDGTSAIFSTCANPDADPLGHWCQVDPTKCDNFATILKNGDQKMSIDYCGSKYKGAQQAGGGCKARLKLYDQCGGKSNCTTQSSAGCVNAPWPGACCPRGSECRMQDAFYYQCLPLDADQAARSYKTAPVGGSAGEVVVVPKNPHQLAPASPAKKALSPASGTAAAEAKHEIASSSLDDDSPIDLSDDEEDGDPSKVAGQRLWVKLRLSMDYDLLVAQPLRVAQFKHDVAHFLREVVGDTKFVYGTGVDEVLSGSVVAVSYIDFTKNAPNQAVDAAMEQLHTNGRDMFADSGLPAKYGWLLSYNMGQSKADMIADDKGEVQIQAMNFPSAPTRSKSNSKLSLTITIAIAVGGLLMILAIVCAVMAMRHRRARRQQQQQQQARAKKPAPKVLHDKIGGVGGTTSGYLADLDGMLDDDHSDKIKSSTGKSHSHTIPDSRVAGVGLRGPLSSKATLNLHGSNTSTSASKQHSEAGGTVQSRLWHWLQRAEPPACVDAQLEGQPTNSPLSSPEVSCNISASLRPKDSPRNSSILPTPRTGVAAAAAAAAAAGPPGTAGTLADRSDPGGGNTFRVPPPSPRYTDRAAAADSAAAAAAMGGNNCSSNSGLTMHSPRPAPAGAALLSGSSGRSSGMHAVGADAGRSRSTNNRHAHAPVPAGLMSPRPASNSTAAAVGYDHGGSRSSNTYNLLDTIVGGSSPNPSSFNGMSDYGGGGGGMGGAAAAGGGGGYGACMADGRAGQGPPSRSPSYGISTIHPTPRVPTDSGDLPPGISMGPFLRAAIKSLTGQSLGGRSGFGSDGGNINGNSSSSANPGPGPASSGFGNPAAAGMYGGPQHSAGHRGGGLSSPVPPPHHQGSSNGYGGSSRERDPYGGSDGYSPAGSNGSSASRHGGGGGAGAMAAAVRASAQAQAEQDAAEDPGLGAGSGSVFQSLWMQRLVAAAQAQQAEMLPPGRANVRLEDAHMYGQPRR